MPSPSFSEFSTQILRPTGLKLPEFQRNGRLIHVLFPDQFDPVLLDRIAVAAEKISLLARDRKGCLALRELLPHREAMLFFTQPSTRTYLSFQAACHLLGMDTLEIRDPAVTSAAKGEPPLDAIRMFSVNSDIIIMRSEVSDFAETCAYLMNNEARSGHRAVPIINAGSGADQHPTQALLDIYTLQNAFRFTSDQDSTHWSYFEDLRKRHPQLVKGLTQKHYGFCGDLGRGRTVRSLVWLLSQYQGITLHFFSPNHPKLRMDPELRQFLLQRRIEIHEHTSLDEAIHELDALYMTRIQSEHDGPDSPGAQLSKAELEACHLTEERANRMKDYAPILHPLPRNEEIPFRVDQNPRAKYFEQAANGKWVRAALLVYIFDVEAELDHAYRANMGMVHNYNQGVMPGR
jgi:aspartate carbamoyltransferase catalytic subunit